MEEIAISEPDPDTMHSKLMTARDLHLFSLDLCERTFGVWNIQTAKHFGNLGRLFQSLEHNATAEEMHLKAIMIKERLLGPNDFEVGLSIGHLASLYNYHMNMYEKAEQLYLRSIQITNGYAELLVRLLHQLFLRADLNLFGPGYSGLEYDYRGLQRVYRKMHNIEKMIEYIHIFNEWQQYRLHHNALIFSTVADGDAMQGYFEPSPPAGTLLNTLWKEFHCEFEVQLGENAIERTPSPKVENEASRSTGL
ncbi:unnamed protein product [Hymenolepis diminuta]|uniref:Uncharacterized protein n=1 Tax=Hymenolepis diminuta TaxID=6216 RepID=A0A3P6YMD0_HYMDI|nr:unnamed protein product [Hymenolepis diminuta]